MRVLDKIARSLGYVKASRTWPLEVEDFQTRQGIELPEGYDDYSLAYGQVVWVYACVSTIAQAAASVPLSVFTKVDGTDRGKTTEGARVQSVVPVPDSPLSKLLEKPNPHMSQFDLWETTVSYLELSGNCYWEIEFTDDPSGTRTSRPQVADASATPRLARPGRRPSAIYPMRPDRVKIVPDKKEYIRGYMYEVNGKRIAFNADEVIHFKYFNPLNEYYGMGPIAAARNSIIVDQYSVAYNKTFYKNGARPDGVLETDTPLTDDTLRRLRKQWEMAHKGVQRSHRVAILEEGLKYKQISISPRDMEFFRGRKLSREEICAVFKVPPALVGLYEYANYANSTQQDFFFWENTMIPKLRKIENKINSSLVPLFGDPTESVTGRSGSGRNLTTTSKQVLVRFDLSAIEALKENEDQKSLILERYARSGIYTINELRAKEKLPPVPWGDTWYVRSGTVPVEDLTSGRGQ